MPMDAIRFKGWHFGAPHPTSGPMSKQERALWLSLIMQGSFFPAAGPKERKRLAYGEGSEPREERSGTLFSRLVDK